MNINTILKIQEHEKDDIELINRWLPSRLFDAHLHCWSGNHRIPVINDGALIPGETFNNFPWHLHRKMLMAILPKIEYSVAVFGLPSKAAATTNDYVRKLSMTYKGLAPVMLLTGILNVNAIRHGLSIKFFGAKPYPTRDQKRCKTTKIIDMLPDNILRVINAFSSATILHLPKNIFEDLDELLHLATKYPDMKFVVAHMGNNYRHNKDIKYAFKEASRKSNIAFDTSMITDSAVIIDALTILRKHQIIFGSDAPFSYMRGQYITGENAEVKLQCQAHFNWINNDEYEKYRARAKSFKLIHINIVLAIMEALKFLGLDKDDSIKNNIFYHNGKIIFTRRK